MCICGDPNCVIPFGLCHCGCAKSTSIFRGRPQRFSKGHKAHRLPTSSDPAFILRQKILAGEICPCGDALCGVPYGTCHCGCGDSTGIVTSKNANARWHWYVGKPRLFVHNHHMQKSSVEYIIEDRGYKTPCWIWQRHIDDKGYGKKGKGIGQKGCMGAHKWYWQQKFGPVPEGMMLDHLCRVRPCCNPDHLEPVTSRVNTQRGITATVTPEMVLAIRKRLTEGISRRAIAAQLNVSLPVIHQIASRKTWKNI